MQFCSIRLSCVRRFELFAIEQYCAYATVEWLEIKNQDYNFLDHQAQLGNNHAII